MLSRIRWICSPRARRIPRLEGSIVAGPLDGPDELRRLAADPPDVFVIDLDPAPATGRDVAIALRSRKGTRGVPIVFVGGSRSDTAAIRSLLEGVRFAPWGRVRAVLGEAIAEGPVLRSTGPSAMAGYSGTPLRKKLGIRENGRVLLRGAPRGFEACLGPLPSGAVVRRRAGEPADRVIWFVRRLADLERGLDEVASLVAEGGGLWIAWPKRASGIETDVTQASVRRAGLDAGWVDYKICAIDAIWSGLLFARRR